VKLVRHGRFGSERPGIIDEQGVVRDLTGHVPDIDLRIEGLLDKIGSIDLTTLAPVSTDTRLGCPVANVSKFLGIGLNYSDHAMEAGLPIPEEPVLFMKAISSLSGPFDPIVLPPGSKKTDWEVELGIVIGKRCRHVGEAEAAQHIAGYCVVNDVSEREYQNERGGTWDKGKGCDSFGPVGPWLVTREEIPDDQALDLWLDVNGTSMQRGSTSRMIFPCLYIVAYLSRFVTLMPGDIVTTGTPPGVGFGQRPPHYLRPGDRVTLGISGLGEQAHEVIVYG
jgi:2-keto-4-pentenoate hydratase/2-oxohepta-3-ene-1,7-dioic acid hydratase in catechol pathway